ncbi:unnamed protein product, partial [Mesorhabditis spiculigera]
MRYDFHSKLHTFIRYSSLVPLAIILLPYTNMVQDLWEIRRNAHKSCATTNHPQKLVAGGCLELDHQQIAIAMEWYNRLCPTGEKVCDIVSPFIDFPAEFLQSPGHSINFCDVPNRKLELVKDFMCHLDDESYFKNNYTALAGVNIKSECHNATEMPENSEYWSSLALIEDPLERFIYEFYQECELNTVNGRCYECDGNLECFLGKQHVFDLLHAKERIAVRPPAQYFVPQNWHCHFRAYQDEYRVFLYNQHDKWSHMLAIKDVLLQNGFSEQKLSHLLSDYALKLADQDFHYGQLNRWRRQILERRELYGPFVRQFFYDYIIFRLPFPEPKFSE